MNFNSVPITPMYGLFQMPLFRNSEAEIVNV
jgi:hypothetical protein